MWKVKRKKVFGVLPIASQYSKKDSLNGWMYKMYILTIHKKIDVTPFKKNIN